MASGSYIRKQFVGGAPSTSLTSGITDVETSITIADAAGWPDATNPFVIVIDQGLATEEKLLISARTGTTLTVSTRGYDDTTGYAHSSGAIVQHWIDASTIDQANRLANLMTSKGDIILHNGTNPVRVAGPAFSGAGNDEQDGYVLEIDHNEGTGAKWSRPVHVTLAASAPAVDGVPRLWWDTNTGLIRPSDGATWLVPSSIPLVADTTARDTYFGAPPPIEGTACMVGASGTLELQVWDGTIWQRFPRLDEGIPKFTDAAARDAYYTSPTSGDHAFLADVHQMTEYRVDEWILAVRKITTSDTAPTSPRDGDIWIQPV